MATAFVTRHLGPRDHEVAHMLDAVGVDTLEQLMEEALPGAIRTERPLQMPAALSEAEALARLEDYAGRNRVLRSWLGGGYHDTYTPSVLLRNILENPGWYTAYTPYQAEISQGRLEALLIFQTMVQDLTGTEVSNASMLDEATAAAEAMTMAHRVSRKKHDRFLVADDVHPQSIAVMRTRAEPLGISVEVLPYDALVEAAADKSVYGALVQYPGTTGTIFGIRLFGDNAVSGYLVVVGSASVPTTLGSTAFEWQANREYWVGGVPSVSFDLVRPPTTPSGGAPGLKQWLEANLAQPPGAASVVAQGLSFDNTAGGSSSRFGAHFKVRRIVSVPGAIPMLLARVKRPNATTLQWYRVANLTGANKLAFAGQATQVTLNANTRVEWAWQATAPMQPITWKSSRLVDSAI